MWLRPLILVATILIAGCSSTDKTSSIKEFKYEVGNTTREQVIEALGLPDVSESSSSVDMIGYKGAADGSHLFIPLPVAINRVSPDMVQAFYTDIGPKRQSLLKKCEILFFFNHEKKLINVTKPSTEEKS